MFKNTLKFTCLSCFLVFSVLPMFSIAAVVDYDIVYVRYDVNEDEKRFVTMPQGEQPYKIEDGADLMLLKKDGSEVVLVDCEICSVMDPTISLDGKFVYYSYIEFESTASASWIYKIKLEAPYTPIRLTFDDGFDSHLYAVNTSQKHDQISRRGVRDMAPVPLADGRLLFASNRAGLSAFSSNGDKTDRGSVQQLYTMSDHDGELSNRYLSNIQRLETGTLHLAQHPMQLMDGRILFSSWQDVATKFHYAMTSLFTVNPDGTNLRQFTEPHDHHKMLEHFITQLPDEQVVSTYYYPSFDFGFGLLMRYPIASDGPDFLRGSVQQKHNWKPSWVREFGKVSHKAFDRKGTVSITPHTTGNDTPAPILAENGGEEGGIAQGKYSMPSIGKDSSLLVAYSTGYVNHFTALCGALDNPNNKCDDLQSGIYLIPDASSNIVTHNSQLIKIKDDPNYNEIWPRAVLSYQALYGLERPKVLVDQKDAVAKYKNQVAEASAFVGTSSMYNRESAPGGNKPDPFQSSASREIHDGNWTKQGADAGIYTNEDIYAVRLISTPAKPFTLPLSNASSTRDLYTEAIKYTGKTDYVVARYASLHKERWEILGEFPLPYKQGNSADTSWLAKIPAETPFLIQALDKNGMTLNSELTWRALKSGEVRTDCGGCHAHSIEPIKFENTMAGKKVRAAMSTYNIDASDPRVKNKYWDLSQGSIPVLSGAGISFINKGVLGIEFKRDVKPILENACINCHTAEGEAAILILDGSNGKDPYLNLTNPLKADGKKYIRPQRSRYIRVPQARQSLLTWVVWGERLDGRSNETRDDDIDYTPAMHNAHKDLKLSNADKRTIARWIDLGSPTNFSQTDGMGYTDDNQLPIVNLQLVESTLLAKAYEFVIGVHDVHSGIDWSTVKVSFASADDVRVNGIEALDTASDDCAVQPMQTNFKKGLVSYSVSKAALVEGKDYVFSFEIKDKVGNKNIMTQRFSH